MMERLRRRGAPVATLAIVVFLATMFPIRPAAAEAPPPIDSGIGGASTLASPAPEGGAGNALASVDPSTGAAQATLPFELPAARGDAQPSLALVYSSALRSGVAGVGWSLNLASIERKGAAGFPKFIDDPDGKSDPTSACGWDASPAPASNSCADRFVFGGKALVPLCVLTTSATPSCPAVSESFPATVSGWTYFRADFDEGARYFWSPDRATWLVQYHGGLTSIFGRPLDLINAGDGLERADALFRIPTARSNTNPTTTYRWNLVRQLDVFGNVVVYRWQTKAAITGIDVGGVSGMQYLTDIYDTPPYVGDAIVTPSLANFAHHTRLWWSAEDDLPNGVSAMRLQTPLWRAQPAMTLQLVDVTSAPFLRVGSRAQVRRYRLGYKSDWSFARAFLTSVTMEGTCPGAAPLENGAGDLPNSSPYVATCGTLLPTTLSYGDPASGDAFTVPAPATQIGSYDPGNLSAAASLLDIDGDSLPELVVGSRGGYLSSALTQNQGRGVVMEDRTQHPDRAATIGNVLPGKPFVAQGDFLSDGRPNLLWFNTQSSTGSSYVPKLEYYSASPYDTGTFVRTWVGDGTVGAPGVPAFFPKASFAFSDWDGHLNAIDLDGDGLTDALLAETFDGGPTGVGAAHRAYLSARNSKGVIQPFAERTVGSCVPHTTGAPRRLMADYDGDGLADMVELRTTPTETSGIALYAYIYKNRGDGRFGLSGSSLDACGQSAGAVETILAADPTGHKLADISGIPTGVLGLHDLTGDGFADLVSLTPAGISIFPWRGGIFESPITAPGDWTLQNFDPRNITVLFGDVKASGVDDLVVISNLAGFGPQAKAYSFVASQKGSLLTAILSGSGVTTRIAYDSLSNLAGAGLDNPRWALPVPAFVVTGLTTDNGMVGRQLGQAYASHYQYESPVYDARDRAFLGFQRVTEARDGDATAPSTKTRTSFATHTCKTSPGIPCPPGDDYVSREGRGLPYEVEVELNDPANPTSNQHFVTTVYTYPRTNRLTGMDGRVVRRAWTGRVDTYLTDSWDPQNASGTTFDVFPDTDPTSPSPGDSYPVTIQLPGIDVSRHLRRDIAYDYYAGAPTNVNDYEVGGTGAAVGQPISSTTQWALPAGDPTGWNYRPTVQTSSEWFGRSRVREVDLHWTYQGRLETVRAPLAGTMAVTRVSGIGGPLPTGASVDNPSVLLRSMVYNTSTGNLTQVLEPNVRCTVIGYDSAYSQLPVMTSLDPASSCGAGTMRTTRMFDRGTGAVTRESSPADETTATNYDGFGRPVEVFQPSTTSPGLTAPSALTKIHYGLPAGGVTLTQVETANSVEPVSYVSRWVYADGFGRTLATLTPSDDATSWIVNGLASRTTNGQIAKAYVPSPFAGSPDTFSLDSPLPTLFASFTYDALGRRLTSTGLDGSTTTYTPHTRAFAVDVVDPERPAAFMTYTHDEHGRLASVSKRTATPTNDVLTTSYTYAPTGEVLTRTLSHALTSVSDSITHAFVYDSLGRLVQNSEPNSGNWTYAYNDHGDLVGTSDPRGCGKNIAYDALGRLSFEDYSPCLAPPAQFSYSSPDPYSGGGKEKVYVYDQQVGVAPPPAGSYLGKVTAVADRAQVSMFDYDPRGRVTTVRRQLSAPGASSVGNYTPNVFEQTVQIYDEADRPVTVTSGADHPSLLVNNASTETFTFSPRGGISRVDSSYGTLLKNQTFDVFGAMATQVLGDAAGTTVSATYSKGRIDTYSVKRTAPWSPQGGLPYNAPLAGDPETRQPVLADLSFTYWPSGHVHTVSDANGSRWPAGSLPPQTSTTYDDDYRLVGLDTTYAGSTTGNDRSLSPILAGDKPLFPTVDAPPSGNRVRSQTFAYDWKGNLITADDNEHVVDRSPGTLVYQNAGPHQLTSATPAFGVSITPTYDAAGNTTSIAINRGAACGSHPCNERYTYTYNEVGQLETAKRDALLNVMGYFPKWVNQASVTYAYDAGGERVLKTLTDSNAGRTTYTAYVFPTLRLEGAMFTAGDYQHDDVTERVLLPVAQGVNARVQVVEQDVPSGTSGVRRVFFELGNNLGSTSFVIEMQTGELVERTTFQAYGQTESDYRPDRWNNFRETDRYTGKVDDAEVGVVYFGARYYAPMLARWLSPDPLAVHTPGGDMNVYGYVTGSPMRFVDPLGLSGCDPRIASCEGNNSPAPPPELSDGGDWQPPVYSGGGGYVPMGRGPSGPPIQPPPAPKPPPPPGALVSGAQLSQALYAPYLDSSRPVSEAFKAAAEAHFIMGMESIVFTFTGPENTANATRTGQVGVRALTDGEVVVIVAAGAIIGRFVPAALGRFLGGGSAVGGAVAGAGGKGAAARTFTSADPLVADVANAIEKTYPGHVVGVNVPMTNAAGRVVTDADILLQNAIIQVKSGSGKGLTTQLSNTQAVTDLPVIGFGPQLGGSVVRGIQANGGLVTRDAQLLIDVVAP